MNKREENLIRALYERKNTFVVIRELMEQEGCSDKTIRNSLDKIEEYLSKFSSHLKLERVRGKGVCLKIKENSNIHLEDILSEEYLNENLLSIDERRFELTYTLLMGTKPVTLEELAERYYVNPRTITEDLNYIGKQLEKFNLKIVSKQKIGTYIEGNEKDKREALSHGIKKLGSYSKTKPSLKSIFMPHEYELVNKAIIDLQNHINIHFTDESGFALVIHVLFMIKRIKQNQAISISKSEKELIKQRPQYLWAQKLANYLEKDLSFTFPEDETIYLTVHLLGMRYSNDENIISINSSIKQDTNIMDVLLNRLIDRMEKICKVSFRKDEALIRGLKLHLYGSLNRIKYGLSLENPLFEDIKRMNPYIYYEALDIIDKFNLEYNINIPKEEVAYITVHFQASIERHNGSNLKEHKAIIVCHLGIGISNFLQIRLENIFPWIDFIGNISLKDIKKYVQSSSVDFIFSTVDIDDLKGEYIKMNSIIDKTEEIRIKEVVNNKMLHKDLKIKNNIRKFIDRDFIFLRKSYKDKNKIIQFMVSKLYEAGKVDCKFYESVLKREQMDSTEIGGLLAIPHGDANHIMSSTIAILTLNSPVLWENEKVQIVFLLAVKREDYSKDNSMRDFFKYLNSLGNDKKKLQNLLIEDNINDFLKLLK